MTIARLNYAAGFLHEFYEEGRMYFYMLPWNWNNSLLGYLSRITFWLFIKLKKPEVYCFLDC